MSQRKQITDDEILDLIRSGERSYTTASRLASDLPVSRQAVGYRLKDLVSAGKLEQDKISGSGVLYLLADEEN